MPEAQISSGGRTVDDRLSRSRLGGLTPAGHGAALRFAEPRFNQHHIGSLHRQLRAAQTDVIIGLLSALQAKDAYTHHHSLRVSILADRLSMRLRLSQRQSSVIHVAALLHDIGKIAVPETIVAKPGPLNAAELAEMKLHSSVGAEMLRPISFLQQERLLVLHHHEWWDGTGYPNGLAGKSIPLGARVLQVADCIDAMISPRSYKPSKGVGFVIEQLVQGRNSQFDPEIADSAIDWLRHEPDALNLSI